jgi:hypothetical protein
VSARRVNTERRGWQDASVWLRVWLRSGVDTEIRAGRMVYRWDNGPGGTHVVGVVVPVVHPRADVLEVMFRCHRHSLHHCIGLSHVPLLHLFDDHLLRNTVGNEWHALLNRVNAPCGRQLAKQRSHT